MATQLAVPIPSRRPSRSGFGPRGCFQKVLTLALLQICCSILVHAQLPQPLVFSSGGAVALRSDQTGLLTPTAGSPFAAAGQRVTLDALGRFLFAPGIDSIHMFQITDASTGAYQEVPHSPFASPNTKSPGFIAVEPTGQFIAVINFVGENPGESLAETFKIDTSTPGSPALNPVPASARPLISTPLSGGVVQPPNLQKFLIYMGPNPFSADTTLRTGEDFESVTIDPVSGMLLGIQNAPDTSTGRAFAMDPQGRFVVIGRGDHQGLLEERSLAPNFPSHTTLLPSSVFPDQLYIESTGSFVYVSYASDPSGKIHIFAVDPATGALTETPSSPLPGTPAFPQFDADPTGPFQYGSDAQPNLLHAFSVDPQTGYFQEIAGSPMTISGAGNLTYSILAGQQGISGPSISLSATALSFGSVQTDSQSAAQAVTLTSNGAESLAVNSIVLSGPDAADFTASDTCHAPTTIQPKSFCAVSIIFKPLTAGPKQAAISIADSAPGSPHSVQLDGMGVAPPPPKPAVTISPNPLNFPTITQGTKSSPTSVVVTNSGNATLHITAATVGGNNPADFSNATANCAGAALAPNASCTMSVTFAPLAAGQRSESIALTDDASDSPQVIQVAGNANPAVSLGAAPSGSTSATVFAGGTAQFSLQLTPGAGFSGNVTFACSGAPLGAVCQTPSLAVSGSNAMAFTVTVTTSGPAHGRIIPVAFPERPLGRVPLAPLLVLLAMVLFLVPGAWTLLNAYRPRRRLVFASLALVLLALAAGNGCGGGGGSVQSVSGPPPVITPQGTSTIIVTPSATNSAGAPLQLSPIQLTLNVN